MVKMGIIGMGNMGRGHAEYLLNNKITNCKLTAICDIDKPKDEIYKDLEYFSDYKEMINQKSVDAVIIATPHYAHTTIGIYALSHGIHTITEKPVSVSKGDCLKLFNAHKDKNIVFSAMFNQRTRPAYKRMKKLIPALGKIQRMTCICTDWYRTEAYYNSGSWRATWKGEGGGILLNQCPHQLDMITWLLGMPESIYANISFGKYHNIETEDEINAIFKYKNGAIGTFIGSTGEYPGTNSLDIQGENGRIFFEGNKLTYWKNNISDIEYSHIHNEPPKEKKAKTGANYMTTPTCECFEEIFSEDVYFLNQHAQITQNFVNAIEKDEPLIAPGEEGINSVELANGIIMSGCQKKEISLPLDWEEYDKLLNNLKGE